MRFNSGLTRIAVAMLLLVTSLVLVIGCRPRSPQSVQLADLGSEVEPPRSDDAQGQEEAPYDPGARLYEVAPKVEVTLRDSQRERDVLLTVRHPAKLHDGPFPLIIFSHGAGGSGEAFPGLSEQLAARGYVVVQPWHSDSIQLARRRGELGFDPQRGLEQVVDRVDLPDRLRDVAFIMASTAEIEKALDRESLIDASRVGLAGHSAGAMTTQAAAGLRFFPPRRGARGPGVSTPIAGIQAFAVISGQGTTRPSITEQSWRDCMRPMLVIAGSEDVSVVSNETPESRRHPFEHANADGTKYLAYMTGATHGAYQGRAGERVPREQQPENIDWIERITTLTTVAMMDAYIKRLDAARRWLDEDKIMMIEGGELEWLRK